MLALSGIYQNGTIIFEQPLPIDKKVKVIVTFVDEDFTEYEKMLLSYLEKKDEPKKKGIDLNKFSFLQSIEATKEFNCTFSEALIEERRADL